MAKTVINKNHIEKLKQQRRTVGLLQFEMRTDANFSKWYSLTENLVIKAFGQKSNQLNQFNSVFHNMPRPNDYDLEGRWDISEVKEKFKNLLTVFVEELELDLTEDIKSTRTTRGGGSIKMVNTQVVNQKLDVSNQIQIIIENIKQTESDSERVKEAEEKLKELEKQMKSKSPVWSTVKDILVWLLNFGRDTFLQALPIILQKYNV